MRVGGKGTAPRRFVTMNGEPILWKCQIRHLRTFIKHDLSDLNDITYKKDVFISQVNRPNARFPFVSSGVKGHLLQTYCCSFCGCQAWDLYGKHVNQLNVEWNKAVWRTLNLPCKTHQRLLPLIVNGKYFKIQHCSRLHNYENGFFSSENIYVSFNGVKAKTRVTGINECLHLSRTEIDDLNYHLCCEW